MRRLMADYCAAAYSLAEIPPSTPVKVAHCAQGWLVGWCKVTYQGQTGYINSVLLQRQGAVYRE